MIVQRAISLTQPWATLMAIGAKRVETRSWKAWSTIEGGWLAIHAAKGFPRECMTLCYQHPFRDALAVSAGIDDLADLPRGAVIAVARFRECVPTWKLTTLSASELAFGDYGPGRWGWLFDEVRRLHEPIPMKGALGIWRLPRPIIEADLL